jgi:putative membrane protein
LALSACGTSGGPDPQPRPQPRRPSAQALPGGPAAAQYVSTAASLDLYEIQSSEMALTRARSVGLREFAEMMLRAHRGTSAQLSMAGRRLNLLPAASLMPREQGMIDELAAASDFDATYRRQQIAAHNAALTLHSTYAARGASPTLRPVAANAVPILRRHLDLLKML